MKKTETKVLWPTEMEMNKIKTIFSSNSVKKGNQHFECLGMNPHHYRLNTVTKVNPVSSRPLVINSSSITLFGKRLQKIAMSLITIVSIILFTTGSKKIIPRNDKKMMYPNKQQILAQNLKEKNVNIVWIVIDALRADHLGCYGYTKQTSLFIDKFAAGGVLFKNAISQESYTQASVSSYFTSTYPYTHQVLYDYPGLDTLNENFITIAEILSISGYMTAAFVFNPHLKRIYGFDQGFQVYDDNPQGWPTKVPEYEKFETAKKIFNKTESFLKNNTTRPVFLYLHYRDVHTPYIPPPPYNKLYLPEGNKPVPLILYKDGKLIDQKKNNELFISQYDGEIHYTDQYLSKTIKMLSNYDITKGNTFFIISADHGEEFYDLHPGDPGGVEHGRTLYQEQIHIPLIFSFPDLVPQKSIFTSRVSLLDVVPTILEYLGADLKKFKQFQGKSLLEIIENGREMSRTVYCGGNHERQVIIEGSWKLYRYDKSLKDNRVATFKRQNKGQKNKILEELYNIESDPGEIKNLIGKYPEIEKKLRTKLMKIKRKQKKARLSQGALNRKRLDEKTKKQLKSLGYL